MNEQIICTIDIMMIQYYVLKRANTNLLSKKPCCNVKSQPCVYQFLIRTTSSTVPFTIAQFRYIVTECKYQSMSKVMHSGFRNRNILLNLLVMNIMCTFNCFFLNLWYQLQSCALSGERPPTLNSCSYTLSFKLQNHPQVKLANPMCQWRHLTLQTYEIYNVIRTSWQ